MREQVKWNFSNYGYGFNGCPECEWEALPDINPNVSEYCCPYKQPFAVHPETVGALCEKHYNQFREWHDADVKKGNMESWFKGKDKDGLGNKETKRVL